MLRRMRERSRIARLSKDCLSTASRHSGRRSLLGSDCGPESVPAAELAECRFIHDAAFPPLPAILADGAGSGTIAYGSPIENWRERDISGQEVVLTCNGAPRRVRKMV